MKYIPTACLFTLILLLSVACNNSENAADKTAADEKKSEKTGSFKTGVALYSFNKFPLDSALDMAKLAGAEYVEGFSFHSLGKAFDGKQMSQLTAEEIIRVKDLLVSKGISMRSMYVGGAANANEWKYYFELGKALGMEFLVCEPEKAHWDMLDSLGGLYNIKIAIHEHAKGSSAYWHPDSVLAAIKGHANIGTCADLGHWARSGLDPVVCLQQLKGTILDVHMKDIDTIGNLKANDVKVGTGALVYSDIVKELKAQRYTGFIFAECEHDMENNLADVKESLEFIRALDK